MGNSSVLFSVDITKKCNLRCAHCYNDSGMEACGSLTGAEINDILRQIAGMQPRGVCLCGGEPLVCPEIFEWLDILKGNVSSISMVTNGLLCDRMTADRLAKHGLDAVQVSLDGAYGWQHDSLRGRQGAFDGALNAINNLKNAGIANISVSMLPDRLTVKNPEDFDYYCRMCIELGVSTIRCMPFIAMGRGSSEGRSLIPGPEEMFFFQRNLEKIKHKYFGLIAIEWDDPVMTSRRLCRLLMKNDSPTAVCIDNCGNVKPDVYLPLKMGNIRSGSIKDICAKGPKDPRLREQAEAILENVHSLRDLEEWEKMQNQEECGKVRNSMKCEN